MKGLIGRVSLAATSLFVLAACAGDRPLAPATATGVGPSLAVTTSGPETLTCDANGLDATARAWFKTGGDLGVTLARDQKDAYNAGNPDLATDKGFDVLREIAASRGTGRQGGEASDGNTLTRAVIACMKNPLNVVVEGFNVTTAISGGVYEVRGGSNDPAGHALGHTAVKNGNGKTPLVPAWGGGASVGWNATYDGQPTRYLVYGTPKAPFSPENHVLFGPQNNNGGFDLSTHPAPLTFAKPLHVGVCVAQSVNGNAVRLLHGGASNAIKVMTPPIFCPVIASASPAADGMFAFARRALTLLAPQQAFAQSRGGVGSLETSLSPFGPVVVVMQNGTTVTFLTQPSDVQLNQEMTPPVRIKVTTAAGSNLAGVEFDLSLFNNNGKPAGIEPGGDIATTGDDGIAVFDKIVITKTGGYILKASGVLLGEGGGGQTAEITSIRFNVRP